MVADDLLAAMERIARAPGRSGGRAPLAAAVREIASRVGDGMVALQVPGAPAVWYPRQAAGSLARALQPWHARVVQRGRALPVNLPAGPRRPSLRQGVVFPVLLPTGDVGVLAVWHGATRPPLSEERMAECMLLAGWAAALVACTRAGQRAELAAATAVRERIARDLHDGPLQLLSAALLRLRAPVQAGTTSSGALRAAERDLARAVRQLRALVGRVRAPRSRRPLSARIRDALARLGEAGQFVWTLRWQKAAGALRDEVADEVFAVVQEALVNASRHARATRVEVRGRRRGDVLEVVVRDDGVGFDPAARRGRRAALAFGLRGMRERVRDLGGTLAIRSRPDRGTRVVLRVPVAPARHRANGTREGGVERRGGE